MLFANSFDLWQTDAFFSAAEEVQQSADAMESVYREWMRTRREGSVPHNFVRELQLSLGTAKWQLEEFERAVCLSYKSHGNDARVKRHSDFVSAIGDRISHVEGALKEYFHLEEKRPFQWVNLDEDECDDLAFFLSGASPPPRILKTDQDSSTHSSLVSKNEDVGILRTRGSSHQDLLEIIVDRPVDSLTESTTPKERASKCKSHFRVAYWINQRLRMGNRHPSPPVLAVRSIRAVLVLMLTVFLVVPFLMYST